MILGIILAALLIITSILGAWNGAQEHNKSIQKLVKEDDIKHNL